MIRDVETPLLKLQLDLVRVEIHALCDFEAQLGSRVVRYGAKLERIGGF